MGPTSEPLCPLAAGLSTGTDPHVPCGHWHQLLHPGSPTARAGLPDLQVGAESPDRAAGTTRCRGDTSPGPHLPRIQSVLPKCLLYRGKSEQPEVQAAGPADGVAPPSKDHGRDEAFLCPAVTPRAAWSQCPWLQEAGGRAGRGLPSIQGSGDPACLRPAGGGQPRTPPLWGASRSAHFGPWWGRHPAGSGLFLRSQICPLREAILSEKHEVPPNPGTHPGLAPGGSPTRAGPLLDADLSYKAA